MTATSSSASGVAEQQRRDEVSFFDLVTPLVRRWKLIAGTALVAGIVAAIALLLAQPMYTAKTSFTPETSTSPGAAGGLAALAGVANQLGLGMGGAGSVSPDFFVELAGSSELLRSTLLAEFPHANATGSRRRLVDILEVQGKSPEERLQRGVLLLRNRISAVADRPTGIVTLEVDMRTPQLAAAVANHVVELLNQFNLERRQSQSREQRRFTGERVAEAERDLREAERAELAFLQRNRDYSSSPLLTFEAGRLARDVQVKQELFLTLSKAHAEARIAEVRDTPVLTVVDSAVAPFRRSSPKRTVGVLIALMLGTAVGIAAAYVVDFRARAEPDQHPDYHAMRQAWAEARSELGSALSRRRR